MNLYRKICANGTLIFLAHLIHSLMKINWLNHIIGVIELWHKLIFFGVNVECCSSYRPYHLFLYPPQRSCRGVYWFHHIRPSVDKSYVVR